MSELTRPFHVELDAIGSDIVTLAAYSTEAVSRATQALLDGSLTEAQQVIDQDDAIDAAAIAIEEECQRLLALQQPMAGDLRKILSSLWITTELERVGDLASNICKGTRRLFGMQLIPRLRGQIAEMSEEAVRLTRLSVDAFIESDSGLAAALDDIDDRLDATHRAYVQSIFEAGIEVKLETQPAVQLALIGRYYERIGDHAVNIGERVRYMVDGWTPEHAGAARERERKRLDVTRTEVQSLSQEDTVT